MYAVAPATCVVHVKLELHPAFHAHPPQHPPAVQHRCVCTPTDCMAKKKAKKQPAKTAKQARSDASRRKERTKVIPAGACPSPARPSLPHFTSLTDIRIYSTPTQGNQSGPWTHDDLSQELQRLGLRIVDIEPDGDWSCPVQTGQHPCKRRRPSASTRKRDSSHAQQLSRCLPEAASCSLIDPQATACSGLFQTSCVAATQTPRSCAGRL